MWLTALVLCSVFVMMMTVASEANLESQLPLSPKTTEQEDLVTAGQRKINLIWEYTQSTISILVVVANMSVAVYDGMTNTAPQFPTVLSSSLFLIVGFYFSRTNHEAIGGVGAKPTQEYKGR